MQEMQPNRRKTATYVLIMLVVFGVINFMIYNNFLKQQVTEVGYNDFMQKIEKQELKEVSIQSNQIVFTDKSGNLYKTGLMNDANLYERLYKSGASFGAEIIYK